MAENNNIRRQVMDELAERIENLQITGQRRSWPPTQPVNAARKNAAQAIAKIVNENVDRRFKEYEEDKSKTDNQRATDRRTHRRQEAYRTELCKRFRNTNECPYGTNCRFAHNESELRVRPVHPNFKTKLCRNFERNGFCYYGHHCQFIHRSPPSSPRQMRPPPLALSAIHFGHNEMIGGGMNGNPNGIPYVHQHQQFAMSMFPQLGSPTFPAQFHQFGAFQPPFFVTTSPGFIDPNGNAAGAFFASTPVINGGAGENNYFQFP